MRNLQVGDLPFAGNGVRMVDNKAKQSVDALVVERERTNRKLLERLREDPHSEQLMEACVEDAMRGRMTLPKPLEMAELSRRNYSPRFSVEQGVAISRA